MPVPIERGGNAEEWPRHLRVREFPKPYEGHEVIRLKPTMEEAIA